MARKGTFGLLLSALMSISPAWAKAHHDRHAYAARHRTRHATHRNAAYGTGRPYSSSVSPTITCRYPDGTPFDPDIIGGPNHVGDGGPAANLGGFDPCGF